MEYISTQIENIGTIIFILESLWIVYKIMSKVEQFLTQDELQYSYYDELLNTMYEFEELDQVELKFIKKVEKRWKKQKENKYSMLVV